MSSLSAFMRVALSFLLIFCLVAPCPCDAAQPADDAQQEAHSCCPSATDDRVADTSGQHGHDESACSHCGDDTFVGADSLDIDFIGSVAHAPAACGNAGPLIGQLWADVLVVREVGAPPERAQDTSAGADLRGSPPNVINAWL
jgi:metal-dependent amidase/aminoacylase/carboxypeptidase family protein